MMTKREQAAKQEILKILMEEGYVTYSKLFDLFDLNLTSREDVVGFMEPSKARIVVNENLTLDQVSFVVRHEILHEYLDHQLRMQKHMGKDAYDKRTPSLHQIINMAADYEISNRGYTKKDIRTAKHIKLGDREVEGLVTELDHPEWMNMTLEQIYDEMMKDYKEEEPQMKGMISIGDMGDQEQQEMEDMAREAQAQAEQAEEEGDSQGQKQNQQIADAAKQTANKIEKEQNKEEEDGSVFKDEEQAKKDKELAEKVEQIRQAFKKASQNKEIDKEREEKDNRDEAAQATRDLSKYNDNPINRFRIELNNLIKQETAVGRGDTWTRFNKKYTNTGLIKPGSSRLRTNKIPLIEVYFDVSGSVQPYVETTRNALKVLNEYVRRGKIKVDLYYVSTKLSTDEDDSTGGGADGDLIMNNISKTKPDNVIVVTDGDADGNYNPITVPGGVFYLFPNRKYIPEGLIEALRGKALTRIIYL